MGMCSLIRGLGSLCSTPVSGAMLRAYPELLSSTRASRVLLVLLLSTSVPKVNADPICLGVCLPLSINKMFSGKRSDILIAMQS